MAEIAELVELAGELLVAETAMTELWCYLERNSGKTGWNRCKQVPAKAMAKCVNDRHCWRIREMLEMACSHHQMEWILVKDIFMGLSSETSYRERAQVTFQTMSVYTNANVAGIISSYQLRARNALFAITRFSTDTEDDRLVVPPLKRKRVFKKDFKLTDKQVELVEAFLQDYIRSVGTGAVFVSNGYNKLSWHLKKHQDLVGKHILPGGSSPSKYFPLQAKLECMLLPDPRHRVQTEW